MTACCAAVEGEEEEEEEERDIGSSRGLLLLLPLGPACENGKISAILLLLLAVVTAPAANA